MPVDFLSGALQGIGEQMHQKNLLDLQNRVQGNQMMAQHLMKLWEDPTMLPEARQRALEGGMEIYGDPSKDHRKTMGNVLGDIAHIHVQKGSPGWLGGQTEQNVQAENMPIPGLPSPTPPPSAAGPSATYFPQEGPTLASTGDRGPTYTPPAPGTGVLAQASAPAPPPMAGPAGAPMTPPPANFTAPMPAPPPGYTRSGRYSPEELAQMMARSEGLKAGAIAEAQKGPKIEELHAQHQYDLFKIEAGANERGFKMDRDANGNPTGHFTPMTEAERSAQQNANIQKTQAQAGQAEATTAYRRAQTLSEPIKREGIESLIKYRGALMDPNSPMNRIRMAQLQLTQQRIRDLAALNDPSSIEQLADVVHDNPDAMQDFDAKTNAKIALALRARGYPVPTKRLPQMQQNQETAAHLALNTAQDIRSILQQYPDIVGPVMGRIGLTEQEWGSPVYTASTDPNKAQAEQELRTLMTYLLAQESKAVMGGRVPQQWLSEMKKASPNPTQVTAFLEGSLQGVEKNANNVIATADRTRYGGKTNPAAAPNAPADYSVTYQGKKYTFTTPQQLDSFKKEAGIK